MSEKEYKQKAELMFERNTILINQLEQAKEIINDLVNMAYACELHDDDFDLCKRAEQFIKE